MMRPFRAIDLYCGVGGWSIGLHRVGFEVVAAIDEDKPALESYHANFPSTHICHAPAGKLQDYALSLPQAELVVGCLPGQALFRRRNAPNGYERFPDTGWATIHDVTAIVTAVQPLLFLMDAPKTAERILGFVLSELENLGYRGQTHTFSLETYGVPQRRQRVLLCGWRREAPAFHIPPPRERVSAWEAIGDLPPSPPPEAKGDELHRVVQLSPSQETTLARLLHELEMGVQSKSIPLRRLDPDQAAPGVYGTFTFPWQGGLVHPREWRLLTLREGARLQTFPDDYCFHSRRAGRAGHKEIAEQIARAVPPRFAEHLANAVKDYLSSICEPPRPVPLEITTAPDSLRRFLSPSDNSPGMLRNALGPISYRDYLHLYQQAGFLWPDDEQISLTRVGETLWRLWPLPPPNQKLIAAPLARTLAACQSPNPLGESTAGDGYPVARIWRALLELDGWMTSQEIGCVVACSDEGLLAEVAHMHMARKASGVLRESGALFPWLDLATGGGLFVTRDGPVWRLVEPMRPVLSAALQRPHKLRSFATAHAYVTYLATQAALPEDLR
jgi:DNA (cytosine-5)-methyltransferase 1